ncbi:MAG: hypothetical protein EOM31_11625, partial [Bacteroidia bacterium]|nr:hypothetical protein [Bacteroidia bacterium]
MKKYLFFLLFLFPLMFFETSFGQNLSSPIVMGSYNKSFTYSDSRDVSYSSDHYGLPVNDNLYKFSLEDLATIAVTSSTEDLPGVCIYLLDSSGNQLAFSSKDGGRPGKGISIKKELNPGEYYLVAEARSEQGVIDIKVVGTIIDNLINLNERNNSFTFEDTQNTANYANWYNGRYTNDVYYKLTLTEPMDITVSHCGSVVSETVVYLLNESKSLLCSNDNSGQSGCGNPKQAYLTQNNLPRGTYYIVSEGYTQNGVIKTTISGKLHPEYGSADQNYILTRTYMDESGKNYLDQIQYYDGLGRPNELVQKGITPQRNDLVTLQEYDGYNRESSIWLPGVAASNNGVFVSPEDVKSMAVQSNKDAKPYSFPVYEASPLNRIIKKIGAGNDWQANSIGVSTNYLTNTAASNANFTLSDYLACRMYTVSDTRNVDSLSCLGNYAPCELYVTEVIDENGNKSYEFKDKLGQVLLNRVINDNQLYDTYYVYDSYGNRRAVLPPKASAALTSGSWTGDTQELKDYAYLYKYDNRNRCIAKRIPGTDWVNIVCDRGDRPVFSQTGAQRDRNEWSFAIPDILGRVAVTGTCTIADDTPISSERFKNSVVKAERTPSGAYKGYTIWSNDNPLALRECKIYTVNYYDDYSFMGKYDVPDSTRVDFGYENLPAFGQRYMSSAKGLLTGTVTAQLNSASTMSYDYTVKFYDERSRLVQEKSTNHLGGFDKTYFAYNFVDKPIKMQHIHSANGKPTQTELYSYEYDHAGRLLKTKHQLNGGTETLLASNSYDELGRLQSNQRNGQAKLKTNYTYNIRSWMKTISNPLFNETLYYQDAPSTSLAGYKANYNGNISAMSWSVTNAANQQEAPRSYCFGYDNLSRLTHAGYIETNKPTANFSTSYAYDSHGNITTLKRFGRTGVSSYNTIDDLTLSYQGNQLIKVEDAAPTFAVSESTDFKN